MQAERLTTTTLAPTAPAHRRPAHRRAAHRGPDHRSARPIAGVLIGLAVAVAAGLGLVLRAQLLTHQGLSGDEAVAGLMAEQIRHGHLYTFYWGNQYGGGEIYVVALLFAVFGASSVVLNGTATVVTAGAALLLWRTARRLGPGMVKWPAVAAAAAFWVWPEAAVWNSTRQFGFRELTAAAGIGAILFTLRLLVGWSIGDAAAVGLLLGIGWWSSPEFVYFGVAVGAAVGIAACRRLTRPHFSHLLVMGATFVVGALPWLWTNLHTHFASLSPAASPTYIHASYLGRLSVFFVKTLPMMFGLRLPGSGAWLGGRSGPVLYVVAVAVVAAACTCGLAHVRDPARTGHVACCVAVVAFPFEYSAFPATSFWSDGHYGVFVVPLVLLAVVGCVMGPGPRLHDATSGPARVVVMAAVGVVALAAVSLSTTASFTAQFLGGDRSAFWRGPSDPNIPAERAVRLLEAGGIHDAYADYWVAYDLDLLSHEGLSVTDPSGDRWVAEYRQVSRSRDPAWIFYAPDQVPAATAEFGSPNRGPFAYPESLFVAKLALIHVGFHVVHAGVLDAVVTDRAVTQGQVGMGAPLFP